MREVFSAANQNVGNELSLDELDRELFYRIFADAYEDAVKRVAKGESRFYFRLAGQTICLQFAGDALIPFLTAAFRHLITPPAAPDLKICLWDTASTGRGLPLLLDSFVNLATFVPWLNLRGQRGELLTLNDRQMFAALQAENILSVLHLREKTAIYWISEAARIPFYESGAPLRVLLNRWFGNGSRALLHGGAVGTEAGGVLLAGAGGSGKSTAALNCLDSDLLYAGDDYVLVELEPQPTAHSVFQTAKVKTAADLERFPHLSPWLANADGVRLTNEKPMMFVGDFQPKKLIASVPLKAIVFPRFMRGVKSPFVQPFSAGRAFREIVVSTVKQTPGDDALTIEVVGKLVRQLPLCELIFGENQKEIPVLIEKIISENS